MKQKRLSDIEKIELVKMWNSNNYTPQELSKYFNISDVAIRNLLKRRGIKMRTQSEIQRKYEINEGYFDVIDTEEKSYILGLLYADGYNDTNRNSVTLGLKETDVAVLNKITDLIQPKKPLQYVKIKNKNSENQFRLVISNKHMSRRLSDLGVVKNKTFKVIFPIDEIIPLTLTNHFIRGYIDGDGWIGKNRMSIVGTIEFCTKLQSVFFDNLKVKSYMRKRNKNSDNNITQLEISGINQCKKILNWCYSDSKISIERKLNAAKNILKEGLKIISGGTLENTDGDGCKK